MTLLLGAGPTTLVSVADVKDHLQIAAATTTYDAKIMRYLASASLVCEDLGGVVLPRILAETYDGGGDSIMLRHSPVLTVNQVVEYVGVAGYVLAQAATPADATGTYVYTVVLDSGLLVRRASGSSTTFAPGRLNIAVNYTAGQVGVPPTTQLACLELVAHWWRWGQQGNRPQFSDGAVPDLAAISALGYAIPNRVVELLAPLPGIA